MMGGNRQQWLDRLRGLRRTQPTPAPSQRYRRPPSREALRASTFYQSPEAWRQLKLIAFEQGTSQQALLGEALNALFARYGRPPVAVGLAEPEPPAQ